jgi:hypothetical protein
LSSAFRYLAVVCLCGLLVAVGCGPSGPKLVPVSGKVTLDGQPLTAGAVSFSPDSAKGNKEKVAPTGSINSSGVYELSTEGKSGAPVGWYKVTVVTNTPGMGQQPPPVVGGGGPVPLQQPSVQINPTYSSPDQTPLRVEVKAGAATGDYDLKVSK